MPIFDDPKKHLNRMQQELLATEEEDQYDDLSDLEELLQDYLDEEEYRHFSEEAEESLSAYRNYSNNSRRAHTARFVDTDAYVEEFDERDYLSKADYKAGKKSNRGLLIIICLELIAIAAVLGWWVLWLL